MNQRLQPAFPLPDKHRRLRAFPTPVGRRERYIDGIYACEAGKGWQIYSAGV